MTSAAKLPVQCNSKPHMVRCNAPGLLQIAALVLQAEGTTVEKGIVRKSFQQTCDIRILIAVPSKVLWPLKSAGNLLLVTHVSTDGKCSRTDASYADCLASRAAICPQKPSRIGARSATATYTSTCMV